MSTSSRVRLTTRGRWLAGAGVVALLLLAGAGVWAWWSQRPTPVPDEVTIGSSDLSESVMVAEIYAQVLEAHGVTVARDFDAGVREQYLAEMQAGTIDIAPDYIGVLTEDLNARTNGADAEQLASGDVDATVTALNALLAPHDASVATPAPATNGVGFAVRKAFAEEHDLEELSDVEEIAEDLAFGGPAACETSEFCLPGLKDVYGLEFEKFEVLDMGGPKSLNALTAGDVDIGLVLTSDPAVKARDLVILDDDEELQVAQNVTAIVRGEVAAPEVLAAIEAVNAKLTTDELRDLNGQVTIEGLPEEWVAIDWAAAQGLIAESAVPEMPEPDPVETPDPPPPPAPPKPTYDYSRNMGDPSSAAVAQNWPALAECESGGSPTIVSSNGLYHGLYQFSAQTWQAVGGAGVASDASSAEQTYRAQTLWDMSGPGQWPHCGSRL